MMKNIRQSSAKLTNYEQFRALIVQREVISIKMTKDLFVMPDRHDDAWYGA